MSVAAKGCKSLRFAMLLHKFPVYKVYSLFCVQGMEILPRHRRPAPLLCRQFSIESKRTAPLRILYDGRCPLCVHEISWLERRSKLIGNPLEIIDIAQPNYNPSQNQGVTYEEAMKFMHVIRGNGDVVKGVDAFSVMYQAVGLGWVFWALKFPLVRSAANVVYTVWAKHRLRITGRSAKEMIRCSSCESKSRI